MDPILSEIYSTVLPAAPYVLAAYTLMWLVLFAVLVASLLRLGKMRKDIFLLEQGIKRLELQDSQRAALSVHDTQEH